MGTRNKTSDDDDRNEVSQRNYKFLHLANGVSALVMLSQGLFLSSVLIFASPIPGLPAFFFLVTKS